MKEITDKLAGELLENLNSLERFCDEKVKAGLERDKKLDTDWMSAAQMCHSLRTQLYWHMQDMIHHPDADNDKLPDITVVRFTHVSEGMPLPTCDINDLLLWCPDHAMGTKLVLGNYDGNEFSAHFELDDDYNDVVRTNLNVSHYATAPHQGPDPKYGIWLLTAATDTNQLTPSTRDINECIGCGCNDLNACFDTEDGQPCYWIRVDEKAGIGVCSECRDHLERWNTGDREFAVPTERG